MEVLNTSPFEVVFTFVRHPYFGVLVEANAVQMLANGSYSLTFQKIRASNTKYYRLNDEQAEAVKLIEEFEVENVMKKFYTGTKRLRYNEFLLKHYTPELHKIVRPNIEKKMQQVLSLIRNYPMFWAGKSGQVVGDVVKYHEDPASVLFHFRRDETGTNYFVTIRHQDEKIEFYNNGSEIISDSPAWLITPEKLLSFPRHIDGKKIKPFLSKKFIHVDPRQEESYMDKFVKPLLENHDVFAKGFEIVTEQYLATPVLRLHTLLQDKPYISLYFRYADWQFPFHLNKRVNVSLEKTEDSYRFHRIRRSYAVENEKTAVLNELGLEYVQGSLFTLPESQQTFELIEWFNKNSDQLRRSGFIIEQEESPVNYFLGNVDMSVKVNKGADWFDIMAIVRFGTHEIPFIRLKKHILEKRREYILPDGSVAILPEEWFERFGRLIHLAEIEEEQYRIGRIHFSVLDELNDLLEDNDMDLSWQEKLKDRNVPEYELPSNINAELRHYQIEGYNWIRYLHENGIGPLLADDMGLGKTIQTLAVIAHYTAERKKQLQQRLTSPASRTAVESLNAEEEPQMELFSTQPGAENEKANRTSEAKPAFNDAGPCVVIAPKSLLYNWQAEANKFCPELHAVVYSGIGRHKLFSRMDSADLVIMSYGTMRNDIEELSRLKFNLIVVDESQAIKNPSSLTSRSLLKLNSRYKIALTGTPIENTLLDVWSQMNFLNKGLLGSYSYFDNNYIRPIERTADQRQTADLKRILDPFVLRRTKKQVASELPEKIEKIHFCEMTPEQAELYERIKSQYRNEILDHVNQVGIKRSRLKIFNGLMHLRQIALNPLLKDDEYQGGAGKDDEIRHMLQRAVEGNHKVLLFSQFVGYLSVFREMLDGMAVKYAYLDGSMDEKERMSAINQFQNDTETRVFLLSLRAGNSGLNLTAADFVFLADPWWNPFTMRQAEDRAHRIGQDKTVFSYKFITKNTIEEKILAMQQRKTNLAESIIPDEDKMLNVMNVEELEELLS